METKSFSNFKNLSKEIESNKIEVNFVEETMRREVERNRQTFAYPARIDKAILHQKAAKFGFRKNLQGEIPVVCPCCRLRMDSEPIPLCYDTSDSSLEIQHNYEEFKLTPGIAVFFSFLKATIFYIFLLTAFSAYDIYTFDICQIKDFVPSFTLDKCLTPATPQQQASAISVIQILFMASLVVSIIFFIVYRKRKNSWHRQIYLKNRTEQSYTILISNVPVLDFPKPGEIKKGKSQFFYRKHIQDYLEGKVQAWIGSKGSWEAGVDSNENDYLEALSKNEGEAKSQDMVKSISLCYNLNRLQIIDETRASLIQQSSLDQQNNQLIEQIKDSKNEDRFSTIPKKIEFINDCRIVLNNQYASDNSFLFNLTHFVGHVFVSFQYQHYRNYFLEEYYKNPKAFLYNGNYLKIAPAAEPADINWKNLRFTVYEKERSQLNSYFIILLILILEFIVLFAVNFILYNPQSILDIPQTENPRLFMIVASVIIIVVNSILKKVISSLTLNEKHKTKVNEITTYLNKSVIAQFCSSCLTLFFLNLLLGSKDNLHYYGNYFIVISSVIELLYQLIHPSWIGSSVKRWWKYRKYTPESQICTFQCSLNKQFEHPEYEIGKRYSYFIYKVFVAVFFAYPAPLGLFITFITLSLMYWIDKINLFKRSSLYYNGNISISNHALKMIQVSLLLFAAAIFYFCSIQEDKINILTLCGTALAFIYVLIILIAPLKLQRLIFGRQLASDRFIYDECVSDGKFNETYWSRNPATTLIDEQSVTGKEMVTNPALLRRFADPKDFQDLINP